MRAVVLAAGVALAIAAAASVNDGREIYHSGDPRVSAWVEDTRLDSTRMTCASCHGRRGQGGAEGGIRIPAISGRSHPEAALKALFARKGSYMPRYEFSDAQVRSLADYLAVLGTRADPDPGVTASLIRVGTTPELESAVRAVFAGAAIYRRLVEVASGSLGDLCKADQVFAVVAPNADSDCATRRIPLIAAIERPALSRGSEAAYHLRASFEDHARAVVLAARNAGARFAPVIAVPKSAAGSAEEAALLELAKHGGAASPRAIEYDPNVPLNVTGDPTHVIFAGPAVPVSPAAVEVVSPVRDGRAGRGIVALCEGDDAGPENAAASAARLLEQALRESGRELTRDRLREVLESGSPLDAGAFGRVSFTAVRRSGAGRCSVVPW